MKKFLFSVFTLLLFSLTGIAQEFGYEKNEKSIANLLPEQITVSNIVGVFLLITFLFLLIAFLEGYSRKKDVSYKQNKVFLFWAIGIFVATFFILTLLVNKGLLTVKIFVIIFKIVLASSISNEAGKLNRSKSLWWILSFIEPHVALIALALFPKLLSKATNTIDEIENLNTNFKEKLDTLIELKKKHILSYTEFEAKKHELLNDYQNSINTFSNNHESIDKEQLLKKAEDLGLIANDKLMQ
ncbi:MAG: hypothetical protein K2X48_14215 [Chitinophagaceae bacterium]|nr:hypothetical protein [Chitinophagaceae bacterium]